MQGRREADLWACEQICPRRPIWIGKIQIVSSSPLTSKQVVLAEQNLFTIKRKKYIKEREVGANFGQAIDYRGPRDPL